MHVAKAAAAVKGESLVRNCQPKDQNLEHMQLHRLCAKEFAGKALFLYTVKKQNSKAASNFYMNVQKSQFEQKYEELLLSLLLLLLLLR